MNNILKKFSIVVAAVSVQLFAGDTTIFLQNGLDGYTGCEDAYVYSDYYDASIADINFGSEPMLKVLFGKIDTAETPALDKNR